MLVAEELAIHSPERDTLVTIGVFDGVHIGHRHLIAELLRLAREKNYRSVAITFRQHPEDYTLAKSKLPFLTDIDTRVQLLKDEGIDIVVPLSFTASLANLKAEDFIELLRTHLRMQGLVIGSDFALGKDRTGDIPALKKLGKQAGFSVTVVPPLVINGEIVSSTTIRKAMADGNMEKVHALTGRYFRLQGKVVSGAGRGGDILGFPTANLEISGGHALPPDGVYAGIAHVNGNVFPAMTNIGRNPTFGNTERTIESFLLDYHGDLYGHEVSVDFVARLRREKKFESAEELQKQITEDVERGRQLLNSIELK